MNLAGRINKPGSWAIVGFLPLLIKLIIIIPGIGEHMGRYASVAEFFNQDGFAVVGIDHYGHGHSDGKPGASKGYEFIFDCLTAFLGYTKETYHLPPIVLYGHSMGGGISFTS